MKLQKNDDGTFSMIREFILEPKEMETLETIKNNGGWWEFRDYGTQDLCRKGILSASVCDNLSQFGLLDNGDGMAWHQTYYITELGKDLVEQYSNL
jgi:hypothetical protein